MNLVGGTQHSPKSSSFILPNSEYISVSRLQGSKPHPGENLVSPCRHTRSRQVIHICRWLSSELMKGMQLLLRMKFSGVNSLSLQEDAKWKF